VWCGNGWAGAARDMYSATVSSQAVQVFGSERKNETTRVVIVVKVVPGNWQLASRDSV
jgi:hypothetical protein